MRALAEKAEVLACTAAQNQFPVLLRPIADRRKVTCVEFRPLLVDAMLTTHSSGFRILFNSDGSNPEQLRQDFEGESRDRLMPSRLRFSLAHELAHTFFYDLADSPPKVTKEFRSGGGKTELENLERNCDRLAARMLLPTQILKASIQKMSSLDSLSLLQLASQAGVSIEALIRRIGDTNLLRQKYFKGCIILVEQSEDGFKNVAIAKPSLLNIAKDLQMLHPGEKWQLAAVDRGDVIPSELSGLSLLKLDVETTQGSTEQKDYKITLAQAGNRFSANRFLMTFEEVES